MIVKDHEYLDFNRIPESRGIRMELKLATAVGILIIFAIGGSVGLLAGYHHMWPSLTTTRMDLGSLPPGI
jgi:hypothetical protein